jgi:hypothetical protein
LKTALAIPLLTVLLVLYFRRRRTGIALWISAVAFVVLTPFVYLVRSEGKLRLSELVSGAYWSDFSQSASSRFFHFESLMIASQHGSSEHPWQPFVDFFTTLVPRAVWPGKPVSEAARFTHQYLVPGLHAPQDIGVISLPGTAWLAGGTTGLFVLGLVLGVLLRFARTYLADARANAGSVLLTAGLVTFLVFLNDGWGLASSLIQMLIASLGWLVLLRIDRTPRRR